MPEPVTAEELGQKMAMRVRQRREDRLVRGSDAMRRELAAAGGDSTQTDTFNYRTGRRASTLLKSVLDDKPKKEQHSESATSGGSGDDLCATVGYPQCR